MLPPEPAAVKVQQVAAVPFEYSPAQIGLSSSGVWPSPPELAAASTEPIPLPGSNGYASSHVLLDIFCRIAHGFAAPLDILASSFNRVAADQPSDRHEYEQCYELFHISLLLLQVERGMPNTGPTIG